MEDNTVTGVNIALTAISAFATLWNAYLVLSPRRVRLNVVPDIPQGPAHAENPDSHEIRVQVTNLGMFPVYLTAVGLSYRQKRDGDLAFPAPEGSPYPILLNVRESVRLLPHQGDYMRVSVGCFRNAYARTTCGRVRRGTSPTLIQQELVVLEGKDQKTWGRSVLSRIWLLGLAVSARIRSVF